MATPFMVPAEVTVRAKTVAGTTVVVTTLTTQKATTTTVKEQGSTVPTTAAPREKCWPFGRQRVALSSARVCVPTTRSYEARWCVPVSSGAPFATRRQLAPTAHHGAHVLFLDQRRAAPGSHGNAEVRRRLLQIAEAPSKSA